MSDSSQGEGWWVASDGKWYPPEQSATQAPTTPLPPPPAAPVADPSGAAPAGSSNKLELAPELLQAARWATVAGAVLVLIGSFLPWVSVTTIFGSISKAGTEGDGGFTLLLALAAGGVGIPLAVVKLSKSTTTILAIIALVSFAISGLIAIYDMIDVQSAISEMDSDLASASIGTGLLVVFLGAAIGGLSTLVTLFAKPKASIPA
jgi:hypothetical protein